jgi:general secretion pathway protein D
MRIKKNILKCCFALFMLTMVTSSSVAQTNECSEKLFSVTIDSQLTIGDAVENIAETCSFSVVVRDEQAREKLNKNLYYVKLKNTTLKNLLEVILTDNDLHYDLQGSKLAISYFLTKTFKVHYIAGKRIGTSNADVTIANANNSATSGSASQGNDTLSKTGISIQSEDAVEFWKTVENEVQRILIGAGDNSFHYAKDKEGWVGPDGRKWEYNPVAPIVNPEAGMVTVTGTSRQISRVSRYIESLKTRLKSQVLIDVRIMTVTFDDSTTTGVDWNQLYQLQNMTINSLHLAQQNIAGGEWDQENGFTEVTTLENARPQTANIALGTGRVEVSDVVRFLSTQGDVRAISSPRVMAMNNQPALISVGKELFYKIKSSTSLSGSAGATSATEGELVDSVFAGILLDITPAIDDNGVITLKINPSITDTLDPITSDSAARTIPPDLVRRQIATVAKVRDGEHAILGGLISTQSGTKVNKVPLLGDLPIFEYAFKKEEKIDAVEELVIIITPHIVRNSKDVSLRDLGYKKINGK